MRYNVQFGKHYLPKDSLCPDEHFEQLKEHVYIHEEVKPEVMPEPKAEEVKPEVKKEKKAK